MPIHRFVKRTPMPVSAEALYAWHASPGAFGRLNPPWDSVEVLERTGGLEVGARAVLRMSVGPARVRWVAEHTACEPGRMFRDEQREGPFAQWVHTHRFIPQSDGTSALEDEVEYALPLGGMGTGTTGRILEALFTYRHAVTLADVTRHARFGGPPLTIAVTGASGLIGSALVPFLQGGGHTVRVVRRGEGNRLDATALEGADAVIHLAGAGVADARWTAARKQLLVDSRVAFTRQLVEAMAALPTPPRVLLGGSAIGVYGDRGDEVLTEASAVGASAEHGAGFLAGLCAEWEAESLKAQALGTRVALLRTGLVVTAKGGVLGKLLTPFKAGLGGPTGSGRQWMSWVAMEDQLGAMLRALHTPSVSGPLNVVGPEPVRSRDFAKTLGRVLSRPAIAPLPAFALRLLFGDLANGALLASQRVEPAVLKAEGFAFQSPTLEAALRFTLGR